MLISKMMLNLLMPLGPVFIITMLHVLCKMQAPLNFHNLIDAIYIGLVIHQVLPNGSLIPALRP